MLFFFTRFCNKIKSKKAEISKKSLMVFFFAKLRGELKTFLKFNWHLSMKRKVSGFLMEKKDMIFTEPVRSHRDTRPL